MMRGSPCPGDGVNDCVGTWRWLRAAIPVAALITLSACASKELPEPSGKLSDVFETPDWAKSTPARAAAARAVTQNDLLTPDGRCAIPESVSAQSTEGVAPVDADAALAGQGALPAVQGGVALGMTECQVVQRTGAPDTFNISADGTDRVAMLTVTRGSWPGLYRFRGGRLVSIERVDVPAPQRNAKNNKSKKTPAKSQQGLRGAQQ